jgi:hypothetical protein
VFTRQGEQGCGIGFISGQAGDGVDGFRGFFVTHDALATIELNRLRNEVPSIVR